MPGFLAVGIIDSYTGADDERLSVTYRLTIVGYAEPNDVVVLLCGIRCGLRG